MHVLVINLTDANPFSSVFQCLIRGPEEGVHRLLGLKFTQNLCCILHGINLVRLC